MDDAAKLHNSILAQLNNLFNNFNGLNQFIVILNDSSLPDSFNKNLDKFSNLSSSVTNNNFDNYDSVILDLNKIKLEQNSIIGKSKIDSGSLFFESEYLLNFENKFLCGLQGNCAEDYSLSNIIGKTQSFTEDYPEVRILAAIAN